MIQGFKNMSNEEIIEKINANDGTWTPLEGYSFTLEESDGTVWCNQGGGYGDFRVFRIKDGGEWNVCSTTGDLQKLVDTVVQFSKIVGYELTASKVVEVREVVSEVVKADPDTALENARLKSEVGVYERLLAREFNVKAS